MNLNFIRIREFIQFFSSIMKSFQISPSVKEIFEKLRQFLFDRKYNFFIK